MKISLIRHSGDFWRQERFRLRRQRRRLYDRARRGLPAGQITHYNNPIYATNIMNLVDLDVTLNLTHPATSRNLHIHRRASTRLRIRPVRYGATNGRATTGSSCPPAFPTRRSPSTASLKATSRSPGFIPGDSGACPATPPVGSTPQTDYITAERTNNYACMWTSSSCSPLIGDAAPMQRARPVGADPGRHNITATGPYLGRSGATARSLASPTPARPATTHLPSTTKTASSRRTRTGTTAAAGSPCR